MSEEILHRRGNYLVRCQTLRPGEATPWYRDPYRRLAVVLSGDALKIEFRDGTSKEFGVSPGQTDWDEPSERVHRGVNIGRRIYEEVTVFFLDRPDAVPQPT